MTEQNDISAHLQKIKEEPSLGLEALDIMRRRKAVIDEMIELEQPVKEADAAFKSARYEYEKALEKLQPRMNQVDTELNALMEKL